ncbi:hypothetical protein Bhyg_11998 [Pseudolycoriella hygida]|uniref:Uncharacterized protein n=1 Tax=Pseudolycoriella hygida TaxID=35572 RepID=A0A9Q0S0G1_9DIPT|nr:hypothetical protein Bhyg_11998 [Pseudolycoriella hygida]
MGAQSIHSDDLSNNKLIKLLQILEKTFEKYDIEPTVCTQRLICTLSKTSAESVARGYGSSTDKIVDGIFSSPWFLDKVAGTAVDDAIRFGKSFGNCYKQYSACKLKSMSLEKMFEIFIRNIKK